MITFEGIKNGSNLKLNDISSEEYREYEFFDSKGNQTVRIENPLGLNVSKTGGHRVVDAHGVCHYVPGGWKHLSWKAKEGSTTFGDVRNLNDRPN